MSRELEKFRRNPQDYLRRRHEVPVPLPTVEQLRLSRVYFGELTDALHHYSSPLGSDQLHTFTVRTGENGEPIPEMVSETRFPPLDDLPDHFVRLHFAAGCLDTVPISFWKGLWGADPTVRRVLPYFPMQVILWGTGNRNQDQFTVQANTAHLFLGDFSWSTAEDPDLHRDHAEQSFRIIEAYIQVKDHGVEFGKYGLIVPEGF